MREREPLRLEDKEKDMCIFCKIVAGEIPSNKVYEDDTVLAFRDIQPQAPVHVLIIPKVHVESAQAITSEQDALLCHLFSVARLVAKQEGVAESGYRLITNVGADGGQTVPHLHFHLIGGRDLKWDN